MYDKKERLPQIWFDGAHFINDIYTGFLNPIMPFIAAKLSISMAIATVILSVSNILSTLVQPIFGFFADNILKRVFIFWGLLMSAIFISFSPTANNIYSLVLFIAIGSLGSSLFHPQALGFISKYSTSDAAKNMGIFMACGTFGYSCGPMLSAYVTEFLGLEKMPYTALLGIIWALLMFLFVPKMSNKGIVIEHKDFKKAFSDIIKNTKIRILTMVSMLKTVVVSSSLILLPFLWKSMGYTPYAIGKMLFAFLFVGGIASILSRYFEKEIGTQKVLYISMIAPLPLMILFALTYNSLPNFSFIIFVLLGFCSMLSVPVVMVMAQNTLPQYKSIVAGFINGFAWGIVAVVMSVIGFAAQAKGIIPVLVAVSVVPAVCSTLLKPLFNDKA